jgi:hypothetical protein
VVCFNKVPQLFYGQVAQTYLHFIVCISIFSLLVMLICGLYSMLTQFNDNAVGTDHITITNMVLATNLFVQSILALFTTFLLA